MKTSVPDKAELVRRNPRVDAEQLAAALCILRELRERGLRPRFGEPVASPNPRQRPTARPGDQDGSAGRRAKRRGRTRM
jgi:hypothetical protein